MNCVNLPLGLYLDRNLNKLSVCSRVMIPQHSRVFSPHQEVCCTWTISEAHVVNLELISDSTCSSCETPLRSASTLSKSTRKVCMLCSRHFCPHCIVPTEVSTADLGSFPITVCNATCQRFIKRLQLRVAPWLRCAASSISLFQLEAEVSKQHTQLCSRLSNFDGLVRFFTQNADNVPRADMLGPIPELESSVKSAIAALTQLLRDVQAVSISSGHRDEAVRRCLVTFSTTQLTQAKAQFSVSAKAFERLTHKRAFSPQPSPTYRSRTPIGNELDLDSF